MVVKASVVVCGFIIFRFICALDLTGYPSVLECMIYVAYHLHHIVLNANCYGKPLISLNYRGRLLLGNGHPRTVVSAHLVYTLRSSHRTY